MRISPNAIRPARHSKTPTRQPSRHMARQETLYNPSHPYPDYRICAPNPIVLPLAVKRGSVPFHTDPVFMENRHFERYEM